MKITLELLRFLAAPFDKDRQEEEKWKLNPSDRPDFLLNEIIQKCNEKINLTEKFQNLLVNNGPISSSWKFTVSILNLLYRLKCDVEEAERTQSEDQKSIEVLSLQAQFDVQKCMELLVGFGIVPYLLPGIGVPEKLRKKNNLASELFLGEDRRLPNLIQYHRLAQVIEVILEVSSNPSLNSLIVPKHMADIIASLLQICKSPISKPVALQKAPECLRKVSESALRPGALTQMEYEYVLGVRKRLEIIMDNFLYSLPKSLFINSLFLIGAAEKPKWIGSVCNELLYKVLLSPNGVILISSTLLSESSSSNVWKLARVISNLMRDALTRGSNENKDIPIQKLTAICSQCVQMIVCTYPQDASTTNIISPEPNEDNVYVGCNDAVNLGKDLRKGFELPFGVNHELSRIGLFCSIALMDINSHIVKKLVWNHLFDPILKLEQLGKSQIKPIRSCKDNVVSEIGSSGREMNEDMNISFVDIQKIMISCGVAEGLLSLVIPTGISLPLKSFQPMWSLLFQVFAACKSYLERKVQEQNVAQLAQILQNKIENILISLLEVVSSGFGDKLDFTLTCGAGISSSTDFNYLNSKAKVSQVMKNISEERAKSVCEFCILLLLNENEEGNVNLHKFEFQSFLPMLSQDENESVKIVLIRGSQPNTFSRDQIDSGNDNDSDNAFELLSDECTILCESILKHERVASITSQLFYQLLSYENEAEEDRNEHSLIRKLDKVSFPPSLAFKIKSSHYKDDDEDIESNKVTACTKTQSKSRNSRSQELTQLELEGNHIPDEKSSFRKFVVLKLLSDLGGDENVVEECVKTEDYKEALKLVEVIMRKLTTELKSSSNSGEAYDFSTSVSFALGILGTVVETASLSLAVGEPPSSLSGSPGCPKVKRKHVASYDEDDDEEEDEYENEGNKSKDNLKQDTEFWDQLEIFIPHLLILIKSNHPGLESAGIPNMAQNILISIESKGKEVTPRNKEVKVIQSRYEKALEDVANPMLPIKGHGLLQLRRLIEEKDPQTLKNEKNLLQIFEKELINEDSYVYLMTIQGLSAFGLKFHRVVIPILIQEYDFINPESDTNGCRRKKMYRAMTNDERIECRMKIGEVLVKIIQKLGDIAPFYRVPLTNLFFRVVRDDDPLIRASALSNLGELTHLLKFSLGVVLTEVWYCLESLFNCEKDIHVRRAGLHLFVLLLKGIEKEFSPSDLLTNVELGTYIRDARRLLTRIEEEEIDLVAKTHAQLALQELGLIVRKLLHHRETFEHKIRVLDF